MLPSFLPAHLQGIPREQAAALWKSLDRLSSDPAEYGRFIEKMAAESRADEAAEEAARHVLPRVGLCAGVILDSRRKGGAIVRIEAGAGARAPRDAPEWLVRGMRVWVNVVSHERVQAPTTPEGFSATEVEKKSGKPLPLESLLTLTIAAAVGPLRRVGDAAAIDVIVSPWVLQNAAREDYFNSALTEFAIDSAADELGVDWAAVSGAVGSVRWSSVPGGLKYKGGGGAQGEEPVPFPLEPAPAKAQGNADATMPKGSAAGVKELLSSLKVAAEADRTPKVQPAQAAPSLSALTSIGSKIAVGQEKTALTDTASAAAAKEFAAVASANLPISALLFSEAILSASASSSQDNSSISVEICMNPLHVAVREPNFMNQAELVVEAHSVMLALPPSLLIGYSGLAIPLVPLANVRLPCKANIGDVKAKWAAKKATLSVLIAAAHHS